MPAQNPLSEAWILYKRGHFAAALESLEPRIFQNRGEPEFFRVLGLCCLRLEDWKGGETYLERSRQLDDPVHRETLLGLMAVFARRKDYGEAVKIALQILDRNPADRTARQGLAKLRAALANPEGGPGLEKDTLARWLPPFHKTNERLRGWVLRLGVGAILLGGLAAGTWWGLILARGTPAVLDTRKGPENLKIPQGSSDLILPGSGFALTLSPEEIKQGWIKAQKAFQEYHDSRARYEINRLLLSNATAAVKEKARSLLPYLHEPDFARPDDSSTFQEVRVAPVLYEGCTIKWDGVIANLVLGEKVITFDLLLGYQNGQVVEGVVPVQLSFAALLKNSQVVEILGRVALRDGSWYVQGTSLRELSYRAP